MEQRGIRWSSGESSAASASVRPRTAAEAGELPTAGEGTKPGERRVAPDHMVQQLEEGHLTENGRRLDVRSPRDQGEENPWTWQPGDLRLPVDSIMSRYDPQTAADFEAFAKRTPVDATGKTLWEWLKEAA